MKIGKGGGRSVDDGRGLIVETGGCMRMNKGTYGDTAVATDDGNSHCRCYGEVSDLLRDEGRGTDNI